MNVIARLLLWLLIRTLKGGELRMVIVMASLIIWGDITFAQVPDKSKDDVKARLATLGYDENGQPLQPTE